MMPAPIAWTGYMDLQLLWLRDQDVPYREIAIELCVSERSTRRRHKRLCLQPKLRRYRRAIADQQACVA